MMRRTQSPSPPHRRILHPLGCRRPSLGGACSLSIGLSSFGVSVILGYCVAKCLKNAEVLSRLIFSLLFLVSTLISQTRRIHAILVRWPFFALHGTFQLEKCITIKSSRHARCDMFSRFNTQCDVPHAKVSINALGMVVTTCQARRLKAVTEENLHAALQSA